MAVKREREAKSDDCCHREQTAEAANGHGEAMANCKRALTDVPLDTRQLCPCGIKAEASIQEIRCWPSRCARNSFTPCGFRVSLRRRPPCWIECCVTVLMDSHKHRTD